MNQTCTVHELSQQILRFFQEKAMVQFPDFPELFCCFSFSAIPPDSGASDHTDGIFLVLGSVLSFLPEKLIASFRENPSALYLNWLKCYLAALDASLLSDQKKKEQAKHQLTELFQAGNGRKGRQGGNHKEAAQLSRPDSDYDYRTFLRQFTISGEEAIPDLNSFDYIPYYYGFKNYGNLPFLEPLEYTEVNRLDEIAIAIDTSGSCKGAIVRRFLEETWSILRDRENFFAKMRLHLIQCDSVIQDYRVFTSLEEWEEALPALQIQGYGNTDFCPVFDLLNRKLAEGEIQNLRGLIYFTDGDGIFPSRPPEYETAFVFLNEQTEKQKIPDWAIRLNLSLSLEDISEISINT